MIGRIKLPTFKKRWLRRGRGGSFWLARHWSPPLHLVMALFVVLLLCSSLRPSDPERTARYLSLVPFPPRWALQSFYVTMLVTLLLPASLCSAISKFWPSRWAPCRDILALSKDVSVLLVCLYIIIITLLLGGFQYWVGLPPSAWLLTLLAGIVGSAVSQEVADHRSAWVPLPWSAAITEEVCKRMGAHEAEEVRRLGREAEVEGGGLG
jgi:hypothetical protein